MATNDGRIATQRRKFQPHDVVEIDWLGGARSIHRGIVETRDAEQVVDEALHPQGLFDRQSGNLGPVGMVGTR